MHSLISTDVSLKLIYRSICGFKKKISELVLLFSSIFDINLTKDQHSFSPSLSVLRSSLSLTSGLAADRLFKGDMVDADPHFGASLLQLAAGQFALAGGREEALGIRSRGGQGLGGHGTQFTPLAEPAEGDDIWVEMGGLDCQGDDIWRREIRKALSRIKKFFFFFLLNRDRWFY